AAGKANAGNEACEPELADLDTRVAAVGHGAHEDVLVLACNLERSAIEQEHPDELGSQAHDRPASSGDRQPVIGALASEPASNRAEEERQGKDGQPGDVHAHQNLGAMAREGVGDMARAVAGLGRATGQEQGDPVQHDEGQATNHGELATTKFRHCTLPLAATYRTACTTYCTVGTMSSVSAPSPSPA